MRWAVIGLLLATALAQAGEPRLRAPITLRGSDALHRVELPFEAYRAARRDLIDVRIVNARGEMVPMAFAPEPEPEKETPHEAKLPQFPITARAVVPGGSLDVRVRTRSNGALVSIEERHRGKDATRPIAYLLDASQLKFPVGALRFDWDTATPGSEVIKVNVEASDDLRDWRGLASRSPLVRVEQAGQSLAQVRVSLGGARAKYLRVTWDGGPFTLRSVHAESATTLKPAVRRITTVPVTSRGDEGELIYDLGARLPVESLRPVFAERNSVVPFEIAVQEKPGAPWTTVAAATFHRLDRGGVELLSPPHEVGRRPARYWRLKPTVKGAVPPTQSPLLEVHWRPAEMVFVAKGEGPFHLELGDPEAKPSALPITSLIPDYKRGAERELALATLGPVQTVREETAWQSYFGDVSPRRVVLWAVLVLAVVVLGFIAWRLHRQMNAK